MTRVSGGAAAAAVVALGVALAWPAGPDAPRPSPSPSGLPFQGSYTQPKVEEPAYGGHASAMGPPPEAAPARGGPSPVQFEQVRVPIYREGLEQWRHYEAWLEPLKRSLGAVLERYPQVPDFTDPPHDRRPLQSQ